MRPSIHDQGNFISLYNYFGATEQSFIWCIKYSSSYNYFCVSTPTPKSQNLGLYKWTCMPVMVWMSPSIHDEGKCMSIYDNYKVTEQSVTWYFKYSSSCCNFYDSTLTPQIQNQGLSKPDFTPVVVWVSSSIHDKDKVKSLHNHCEATEQSLTKCIKYSKSYDYFHASTPTLKSLNLDLTQSDVTPVVVWMRPSIHDKGKCMSLYNYCEATEQSFTWYFKYSSSCCNFYDSTLTPQIQNQGLSKPD